MDYFLENLNSLRLLKIYERLLFYQLLLILKIKIHVQRVLFELRFAVFS